MSRDGEPIGESRERFMERVRAALEGPSPREPLEAPPAVDETIVRLGRPGADLVDRFVAEAEAAGLIVHRTAPEDLQTTIASVLGTLDGASATLSMRAGAPRDAAVRAMETASWSHVDWRSSPGIECHYDVDAGITDVEAALAESGTIVVRGDAEHSRGTFLVPPVHVAVLQAGQIVPDMIDLWAQPPWVDDAPPPTSIVLVTGPSKTADIEGILVTGVHGPGAVHVVLVEEKES